MKYILYYISYLHTLFTKAYDRVLMYCYKHRFGRIGKNVIFYPTKSDFFYSKIEIGSDVYIGPGASFIASISKIVIQDKVLIGPNVTIRGGNHSSHLKGKFLFDYKMEDKMPSDDMPVLIESDVWIGTGAIILKGVTVGQGSIIGAGSVVTKSVPRYSVVLGVPGKVVKSRFTEEEIEEHERLLARNK